MSLTHLHVTSAILNGNHDDELDSIVEAARARQKAVRDVEAASLRTGHYVELVGISPKYLEGARGHVVERRNSRIGVKLESSAIAFKANRYVDHRGVVFAAAAAVRRVE